MINFTVYGDCHGKGRPKFARVGKYIRTYTDKKTTSYENLVKISFLEKEQKGYMGNEALSVSIQIYQSIPKSTSKKKKEKMLNNETRPNKKPDADNVIKSILDGLNTVAFRDDSQIVHIDCDKYYSSTPRVEVTIKEVNYE